MTSFPFPEFETAILKHLHEIDHRKLFPPKDSPEEEIESLKGKRAELSLRINGIKAKLLAGGNIEVLAEAARDMEAEMQRIDEEVLRLKRNVPISNVAVECRTLIDLLRKYDDEDTRVRLRGALRRLVESIQCLFIAVGRKRAAVVQIVFREGESRFYLIIHRPAHSGFQGRTDRKTESRSMRYGGDIDLRNQKCLPKLEDTVRQIVD